MPLWFPPHQPDVDVAVRHVGLRHDAEAAACVVAGIAFGWRLQVARHAGAVGGRPWAWADPPAGAARWPSRGRRERGFVLHGPDDATRHTYPVLKHALSLSRQQLPELSASDEGFRIAAEVRHLLIERGRPALVIINGNPAVEAIEMLEGKRVT